MVLWARLGSYEMGPWNCGVVLGSHEMGSRNCVMGLNSEELYRSIGWDCRIVGWCWEIEGRGMALGPDPGTGVQIRAG